MVRKCLLAEWYRKPLKTNLRLHARVSEFLVSMSSLIYEKSEANIHKDFQSNILQEEAML